MTLRRIFASSLAFAAAGGAASAQQTAANQAVSNELNLRYADGIVAIAEDKVITVDDVQREIAPYVSQFQRDSHSEQEFDQKVEQEEDSIIQQLIDRALIVKEFHKKKSDSEKEERQIPPSYIDDYIADELNRTFDNDRSKFLAYLRSKGETIKDYRKEVEEDIIYEYMLSQQRKSQTVVSPVRIEQYYKENKDQFYQEDSVHVRMIQFSRHEDDTDDTLRAKGRLVLARLRDGERFEDIAREVSEDLHHSRGSDWNWMTRTNMNATFTDQVFALKKGDVTQPIITPDGCFIFYVEDRKYAGIQPLEQVRDQIEHLLVTQMSNEARERWLERLRRDGYVKHF